MQVRFQSRVARQKTGRATRRPHVFLVEALDLPRPATNSTPADGRGATGNGRVFRESPRGTARRGPPAWGQKFFQAQSNRLVGALIEIGRQRIDVVHAGMYHEFLQGFVHVRENLLVFQSIECFDHFLLQSCPLLTQAEQQTFNAQALRLVGIWLQTVPHPHNLHIGIAGRPERLGDTPHLVAPYGIMFARQIIAKERQRIPHAPGGHAHAVHIFNILRRTRAFHLFGQSRHTLLHYFKSKQVVTVERVVHICASR